MIQPFKTAKINSEQKSLSEDESDKEFADLDELDELDELEDFDELDELFSLVASSTASENDFAKELKNKLVSIKNDKIFNFTIDFSFYEFSS